MIHLVTAENRHLYESALLDHFKVRHDIYVGERKWMALASADGLERDQFDDDDTDYILALENGRLIGGSRFYPTTKPHLLSEIYPSLAARGVPRGPDIVEWTRYFVVKERREGWKNGALPGQILCAGLEYAVERGVRGFTLLLEIWWIPRLHELGWKIQPLGTPELIEGDWWIAALIVITPGMLEATRRHCGVAGPILQQDGINRPSDRRIA